MRDKTREPRPYVMRGAPAPTRDRPTVADPPDRRVAQPFPRKISLLELRALSRGGDGAVDPRLRPADRWLQRWAATGSDISAAIGPLSFANVTLTPHAPTAHAVPLNDAESLLIDGIVRGAPPWAKTFAILWYRSAWTVQEIADALKIRRRRAVYEEREIVLAYYLGRFCEVGLQVTLWVDPD